MYSSDTAFVGHLGKDPLSAVTLAQAWSGLVSVLVWSSAYALNSVCAQAIGAGNKKLAGHWLQLALGLVTLQSLPVLATYFFTDGVLRPVTDGNAHVDALALQFNEWSILAFLPTVWYMAIRQFMQALQVVMPATIVSLIAVGVNVGLNQMFIHGDGHAWRGWGFVGSPIATACSLVFQLALFVAFAFAWKGYHRPYWPGWSWASFRRDRVRRYMRVVLPMMVGSAFENWGYQLITFASGRLETVDVAAMSVLYGIWGILWAFYWGWGLALQVRVGMHLGAARPQSARLVARLSLQIVAAVVVLIGVCCIFARQPLAAMFSGDDDVVSLAAAVMPVLALDYAMGCCALCATNVLEGMSRNALMAAVNGACMWLVQVPLSIYFAFSCPLFRGRSVFGFWWGSVVGETLKAAVLWAIVARVDWQKVSREAVERSEAAKAEEQQALDTANIEAKAKTEGRAET